MLQQGGIERVQRAADPAPILATLNNDVQLRGRFHIGLVITLVDASHAELQERLHPEWLAQVAAADRLLLSKTDLAGDSAPLRAHLQALNAGTPILDTQDIHSGATAPGRGRAG